MDLPTEFTTPDLSDLNANDTIPSNIDLSTISYVGELSLVPLAFFVPDPQNTVQWPESGMPISLNSFWAPSQAKHQEWSTVETVLIRIDTNEAPSGRFSAYLNSTLPDPRYIAGHVYGYDAAVCVQKYESWIIETYNTSIASPSALRVVGRWDGSIPVLPSGDIQGAPIANTRYLNTTGKTLMFLTAQANTAEQMQNDDYGGYYIPTATVGPVVPPRTSFLLTSAHSTGHFFNQWDSGVHRTLSRPVRHYPRTGRCSSHSTIPCGVGTRCRTIVRG